MFTDRFIEIPIKIVDRKNQEMGVDEEGEDSIMKVNPFEIASYFKTYDNDKSETVAMVLKGGDKTIVHTTFEEFEKLLNKLAQ